MIQVIVFFIFIPLYSMDDIASPLPETPQPAQSPLLELSESLSFTSDDVQITHRQPLAHLPAVLGDTRDDLNNLWFYYASTLQGSPEQRLENMDNFLSRHYESQNYKEWRLHITIMAQTRIFNQLPLGDLPIEVALAKNDRSLLWVLLQNHAYKTLEEKIFRANSPDILEMLLDHGAKIFERNLVGDTVLHAAMREGRNPRVVEYLRQKRGLTPLVLNSKFQNPLHIWAARFEHEDSLPTEDAKHQFHNLIQGLEPIAFQALINMPAKNGKKALPIVERFWPLLAKN
jgi:hypothetical protein